jgi:hypothetical protein
VPPSWFKEAATASPRLYADALETRRSDSLSGHHPSETGMNQPQVRKSLGDWRGVRKVVGQDGIPWTMAQTTIQMPCASPRRA